MSGVLIRTLLVAATLLASSLASPALAAGTESAVPAAGQRLSLADAGREIGISDQVISPDGKRVAVLISRVDYVDNRFASSLRVIDVESGRQLLLASERSRISSPRWSPSGNELAWLDTEQGGQTQLYVSRIAVDSMAGDSRATRVTDAPRGIGSYAWSPDGRHFLVTSTDAPAQRVGDERFNLSFEVTDGDYLRQGPGAIAYLGVMPSTGGAIKRLTASDRPLGSLGWGADAVWIDNRSIAYISMPGDYEAATIQIVDTEANSRPAADPSKLGLAPLQYLLPSSPDGNWIAFGQIRGQLPLWQANGIAVMPAAGGARRDVTAAVDRSFREAVWLPDSKSLIAVAPDGVRYSAWQVSVEGAARKLDLGAVDMLTRVTVSSTGALSFIGIEAQRPGEVYYKKSASAKPQRLTHFNDAIAALDLGRTDRVQWSQDGFEQDAALIYPPGFQPGRKYPLVVKIHGGPMSSSSTSFTFLDQLLAAQGWLVFQPNYRGSNSNGAAFQNAVINDSGEGPGRDIMAGIAKLIATGIVDEQRIAVSGWSYGGYLTAWLTAHYPDVWRAAVAGAAPTSWFDSYDLCDQNRMYGYAFGGSPWTNDNALNYWRQSVMPYFARIRTPTLILANTGDIRVPVTNAYHHYRALKDNQVPVKFIAYPLRGHTVGDPVNQRDLNRRWVQWIRERFEMPLQVEPSTVSSTSLAKEAAE